MADDKKITPGDKTGKYKGLPDDYVPLPGSAEFVQRAQEELLRRVEEATKQLIDTVKRGEAEKLDSLIRVGANINYQDLNGMTVLHHAVACGARPCIRVLVNTGKCDYLLQDKQGRYASELAYEWSQDYAVGRLLAKKEAQQAAARGRKAWPKEDEPEQELPKEPRSSTKDCERNKETIDVFEEPIYDKDGNEHLLSIKCLIDEETASIDFFITITKPDKSNLIEVVIKTRIHNPIVISDVVLVAVGAYALCVARATVKIGIVKISQSYKESIKKKPNLSLFRDKAKDTIKRFRKKNDEITSFVEASIFTCILGF